MGEDVADALQEAHTLLTEVRTLKDVGMTDKTAVNRLYYACFHATRAVLYDREYAPKTHKGVKVLIGKELVQNGELARADGTFFSQMYDHREQADYEYQPILADVDALLDRSTAFVESMEELVDHSDSDSEIDK